MSSLQVWSTDGHGPRHRMDFWNQCATQVLNTGMTVDAAEPSRFWGRIAQLRLNSLGLAEVSSGAAAVRHSARQARSASGRFQILLQLKGTSVLNQGGSRVELDPGDFTLVDCGRQYDIAFGESVANLVISLSHEHLRAYFACPESLAAVRLRGERGPSALTSRFLRQLWRHCEDLVSGCVSPFLDRCVLDMVATGFSGISRASLDSSVGTSTRRITLFSYIEQHLSDPQLSVHRVASALAISPRYVHKLFDGGRESFGVYVRRRRLEECARSLANPTQRGRTISWIAYANGFGNIPHFSKVFRKHFDQGPRDYRNSCLRQSPPATAASDDRRMREF